jgi:hypothetical protein
MHIDEVDWGLLVRRKGSAGAALTSIVCIAGAIWILVLLVRHRPAFDLFLFGCVTLALAGGVALLASESLWSSVEIDRIAREVRLMALGRVRRRLAFADIADVHAEWTEGASLWPCFLLRSGRKVSILLIQIPTLRAEARDIRRDVQVIRQAIGLA